MAVSYQGNHDISYLLSLPRLGAFTSITAWEVAGKWNLCQVWLNVQRQNCPKPKGIKHWFCPLVPFFLTEKVFLVFLVQLALWWGTECSSWCSLQWGHGYHHQCLVSRVSAKRGQLWGKGWNVVFDLRKLLKWRLHTEGCLLEWIFCIWNHLGVLDLIFATLYNLLSQRFYSHNLKTQLFFISSPVFSVFWWPRLSISTKKFYEL